MKAGIITIGDEILIGQIIDTNSSWISKRLTESGFEIEEVISIGDNAHNIKETISLLFQQVDIIITTGGIGPTNDDITKKTLCEYFGTHLVFDESVLENIKSVISNFASINELTRAQAFVPKDCTVIQNKVGTAPITWFEKNGKVLVSLPGVPYEMRYNLENEIILRLKHKFDTESYIYKVFLVTGYTESNLAIYLTDFENNLPEDFGLAYLPSPRLMKLRLFAKGEQNRVELEQRAKQLEQLLEKSLISKEDIPVEKLLGEHLKNKNLTLCIAESCTGGNIAHLITSIPGASRYFKGGIISYSNEVKLNVLNVPIQDLNAYGSVSEQVVTSMAKGIQELLHGDCAIAVSGIAGPDGGTEEKPVGMVFIATLVKDTILVRKYQLGKYREANIMGASNIAMIQLIEMLTNID